ADGGRKPARGGRRGAGKRDEGTRAGKDGDGERADKAGRASGPDLSELTKAELDRRARDLGIRGRSKMNRAELEQAVGEAERGPERRRAS
ncbi:Rho termination factor N-terminal domain-containing protein, partial [Saccharomonospora iraqiensis]|uniref:Rho termination factor N-terminal domain-containing protein n=1 Tax=Saccharomonospora iraqiensis TaxID=52698 RepID=UPI0005568F1C